MRQLLGANIFAGVIIALLLLPGVSTTLQQADPAASAQAQDLRDYNGALVEQNQTLRDSIANASCTPDGGFDVPPPDLRSDDIGERLQREGAASGGVEVTLAWNDQSDLDLSVICPDGNVIRYNSRQQCGGTLDIDMNNGSNSSSTPIEHVSWPENAAPPGLYKVQVTYFRKPDGGLATIPFTVEIKVGSDIRQLQQTASCCGDVAMVGTFTIGEAKPEPPPITSPEQPPVTEAPKPEPLPIDPDKTVVDQGGDPMPLTDAIEKGVVFVVAFTPGAQGASFGSGFLISDRLIVTNRHVVEGSSEVFVVSQTLGSTRKMKIKAQTASSEQGQLDFAVLESEVPLSPAVPLPLTSVANRLEQVVSAGFPGFLLDMDDGYRRLAAGDTTAAPEIVTTEGIIARPARETDPVPMMMHSADIAQGNSGGPLLDLCGRVVGINTLVRPGSETNYHASWAIGATGLQQFLTASGMAATVDGSACSPSTASAPAPPPAGSKSG